MPSSPLLSVVVPTRNEAGSVPILVHRLLAALADEEAEICFVDDSDDETPAVLERLAIEQPGRVRSLLRGGEERRGGLSTAVLAGLRLARGQYVCVMDADLQHPPETVVAMLAAARAGADLVVASRYVPGGDARGLDGVTRRVVSRGATALARALFSEARRSHDPLSGFFLCRRAMVDGIEFRPVGFKVLLELLVLLPEVTVRDVPLRFESRTQGASKASLSQGLQYLRHLRSLVVDVQGSARRWKFAIVGASGLVVFLPLLGVLSGPAEAPALVAFVPAFLGALAWNTLLNRVWTFADLRRTGERQWAYLSTGALAGVPMFAVYALLVRGAGLTPVAAGLVSVPVAGIVNGLANQPLVRRAPEAWTRVLADRGALASLERLAAQIGADRAYVARPTRRSSAPGDDLVGDLIARATRSRRASMATEAASYRPQRRTNVAATSYLVVPIVHDDAVVATLVCERTAPHGFDQAALDTASDAAHQLAAELAASLRADGGQVEARSAAVPQGAGTGPPDTMRC